MDRETKTIALALQFPQYAVEVKFAVIQQQHLAWVLRQYLFAQLTPDTAASAGDEHHFVFQVAC